MDLESNSLMVGKEVDVLVLTHMEIIQNKNVQVNLSSTLFILVLNGSGEIEINFKKYPIAQGDMLLLSFAHFFKIPAISTDFRCLLLNVSQRFVDEMYSADMVYKRVKYGVKMHQTPILHLLPPKATLLQRRMYFVQEMVSNVAHPYYKGMTLNALQLFFYDLIHVIEQEIVEEPIMQQSREDIYFQQFLDLLVTHFRTEHHVDFYATKLNMTTHYLTLIVKRLTTQTVADLISQLLFSEAKLLLLQPKWSIQEIAEQLSFSDQSAFGKFFKRLSGVSPKLYRNTLVK